MSSVLNVQELCDQIAGFLQESKWELRTCSLVSPALTSAAQRHLFSDIIFNRGSLDIDDISHLERYDEVKVCARFCEVLQTSPHLIPYVRRMRISLESGVLKLLTKFEFPNLHEIVFHRRRGGAASEEVVALAAQLIGAPSIRRVGLVSPIFDSVHDMSRLFERHTPALDSIFLHNITFNKTVAEAGGPPSTNSPSRVRVKTLRWRWHQQLDPTVILDLAFPLDLSALVELDFGAQLTLAMQKVVERSRVSIRRLSLDAQHVVNDDYASSAQPTFLAQLPALTHLTLSSTAHHLADAETLLSNLPPQNNLRSLELQIKKLRPLTEEQMRGLGTVCAKSLHEQCVVTVWVCRFASGADGADQEGLVRAMFGEVDGRGRLRVVV